MGRKKDLLYDPKCTSSFVKHGGGSIMVRTRMATSETGTLIFIDDVNHYDRSRMNSVIQSRCLIIYRKMNQILLEGNSLCSKRMTQKTLPAQQRTLSGEKKWKVFMRFSNHEVKPNEHVCHPLKRKLKVETPQKQTATRA